MFSNLSLFHDVGHHGDNVYVMFPDHSPEVAHSGLQWPLCRNVFHLFGIALYVGRNGGHLIDVDVTAEGTSQSACSYSQTAMKFAWM